MSSFAIPPLRHVVFSALMASCAVEIGILVPLDLGIYVFAGNGDLYFLLLAGANFFGTLTWAAFAKWDKTRLRLAWYTWLLLNFACIPLLFPRLHP